MNSSNIMDYLRNSGVGFYVAVFAVLAISEQISNGIWNTKFVIKDLQDVFLYIMTQLNIKHGIDSAFNSPKGEFPK